tara:strand:- start:5 stop:835 length:831 start_codon:yes stop_codon:yes gene_type:complete
MSVVSQSNQQMLFELLKSISTDNQLQINERALEQFITQKCAYFHTNRFELDIGSNLNELNKKIVEQGYNFIMSNQPRQKVTPKQSPQMSKREMFDVGLANQEAHLKKMINPKKPKKIDFSDGSEDFPIQNMERVMNQTLADRQRELDSITQKYSNNDKQKAEKWLNMNENTPKIKIERTTNIKLDNTITDLALLPKQQRDKIERRVTFDIQESKPPNALSSLFSKLKQKKPVSNDDIINKLDTIISNQEKIMKMFSTIKGEKGDVGATGMPGGILH